MLGAIIVIAVVMGIKLWWDFQEQNKQATNELIEKAQVITKQHKAFWEFMIINQNKINYDAQGNFEFKHLNCSTVAMGVGTIFAEMTDYLIKPTHISYRNDNNAPDDFERDVLNKFEQEPERTEYWATAEIDGKTAFRYMTVLKIDESCLSCHGNPKGEYDVSGYPKEGYELGELGGALSLIMPMDVPLKNIKTNTLSNAVFFLVMVVSCIISLYLIVTKLVTRSLGELEKAVAQVGSGDLKIDLSDLKARGEIKRLSNHFQQMVNQLKDLYTNLEQKVENRTTALEEANIILKQHQSELEEVNRKLNEVNQYKSDFLAIMSHELRTPLTSIIAFTELILTQINPREAKMERHLTEIKSSSQILLGMISNILDLAKIEAGKDFLVMEMVDIAEVIASVEGMVKPLAAKKRIFLTINISPDVPLIQADPEKIRRVLENLISNALKFTDANGRIDVDTGYDHQNKEVLITIKDTGIGIREEHLSYIFEKFTQSDSSISRKYGGTGLGLALAKEIIELHNGWIKVDSVLNYGTTFTIGLPWNEADTEEWEDE